jgi:hypothetical protein
MGKGRAALALALFAVAYGTNVSTPLLLLYEQRLDLTALIVTALFAVYPVGLAPALVYSGPASDVLGRRPIAIPGIALSALASSVMMFGPDSLGALFAGRFLLGAVSGLVFVVASAWMQELGSDDPVWATRLTGLTLYAGFGLGPFVSGVLGEWGPAPLVTPYLVHIGLVVVSLAVIGRVPETVTKMPDRRIVPNLGIPPAARDTFFRVVVPTAFGVFGFPSLAFGLFPVLLRPAMASIAVAVTGVVGILCMSAIVPAQAWVGRVGPFRAAPVGIAAGTAGCGMGTISFLTDAWPLLFPASICMGVASGISMTSGLRFVDTLTRPEDRGALTGAFYAAAYAAMTMPLVVATAGRLVGFTAVLAVFTVLGVLGSIWLAKASRAAGPAGEVGAHHRFASEPGVEQ